ncbi:MAG: hypothetical protein IKQ37_00065 [Bacteroidaceae bacterium]|nr:hypothetical protein [Bacteroidaceae bacterium]
MAFDMNAGRRKREKTGTTESQIELREQLKRRNHNLDANSDEASTEEPAVSTGMAAEKPCFITVAIPECIKRIVDGKVKYDSKELPIYNQTLKHIGRRWFLRGLLAEGLITQEQFDEASALHSEYGWERDKVSEKRRRAQ